MISLKNLEQRLTHEMPAFAWSCRPAASSSFLPDTQLPDEIEVTATRRGAETPGVPWRLTGNIVHRWGVDATVKFICSEYATFPEFTQRELKPGWDKLAEI